MKFRFFLATALPRQLLWRPFGCTRRHQGVLPAGRHQLA